ncbi:hypothetical protein JG687_00008892 [Phytophthora cactorum]|uniref:Transmembrane protein n=1 Tax=Phytophthora cactorum TaxID=29920 RepID=A0A8T1UB54_9STRA|nr:hypothetical protein JG687_00008892 [Phytophthora cactorum]
MIRPVEIAAATKPSPPDAIYYQVVASSNELPAFDPLLMIKTVVLSPDNVKRFNRTVLRFSTLLEHVVVFAFILRFATFIVSASVGRVMASVAALLHVPPILIFSFGMRVEYIKIIVWTFDFGVLHAANTLWAIVFSAVLGDSRAVLVFICWINFTNSLLQETHLRNTVFMVAVTLGELLFFAMLVVWLALDFVDDLHHYDLITARGHTLSTKDVLVNVLGTMAMLDLRKLYRRYHHLQQKRRTGTATQSLGYRCKIALRESKMVMSSSYSIVDRPTTPSPLQMCLSGESTRYDPRDTVWPRVGTLKPLSRCQIAMLYICGMTGGLFAQLSLFQSDNGNGGKAIAIVGITMSTGFCGVYTCCSQQQLLKRVVSSFHFLFQELQVLTAGICLMDMFSWEWVPVCGIASGMILSHTFLTVDALTPLMKRRLHFEFWLFVVGIMLFMLVLVLLLVDVLLFGYLGLRDREFLNVSIVGHQAIFHAAPFLFGRVLTVILWSSRYVYIVLTRVDDNALVLLRGNVEFDFENWKRQVVLDSRATRT